MRNEKNFKENLNSIENNEKLYLDLKDADKFNIIYWNNLKLKFL